MDESKLPRWAQERITVLRSEAASLRAYHDAAQVALKTLEDLINSTPGEEKKYTERDFERFQKRVLEEINAFGEMPPEEGENWESWYAAGFDMLYDRIRSMPYI